MDSFCSLFDPSDGNHNSTSKKTNKQQAETVKKKADGPKGRRRGRKALGKTETLPEESSFLCEPELSTELLVTHGDSYIDNYIEINNKYPGPNTDVDKKLRRRNSNRKTRRKKSKTSPVKDLATTSCNDTDYNTNIDNFTKTDNNTNVDNTNWNNKTQIRKNSDGNVGKNVNRLKDDLKQDVENEVLNVIDKLDRVSIKNDLFLAGDFTAEDLNDFYSSEDIDEESDETSSDDDDCTDEVYGSLPPEPRFGNVEYKLQLVAPCEKRFQHLVTQLAWRVGCGGGMAVYVVGVRDCGAVCGVPASRLRRSLHTLARMARAIRARLVHVATKRLPQKRALAEVYIRKITDTPQSVEIRVAVMGANEAGKSTLIGVLTQGELDNGRGSARLNMFRHVHEVKSGRTSSLSHEILGFDAQGNVINYGCSELMTAERIGERSAKLLSFLDLAGHTKYQRTTLHGLTGYSPHYAMLVISATAGITPITEEHIGLLLALDLPFFAVINKVDLSASSVQLVLDQLRDLLHNTGKKPLLITDENSARECVSPSKMADDTGNNDDSVTPVFPVSSVSGGGLAVLRSYLLALQPPADGADRLPPPEDEPCEFQIDEIFHVGEYSGPVVGGLLARGRLAEGDKVIMGPLETGEFVPTSVRTIYRNRVARSAVSATQSASLGLAPARAAPRPGMVLLAAPLAPPTRRTVGACSSQLCRGKSNLLEKNSENLKMNKKFRRKNKNLLTSESSVEKDGNTQDPTSVKRTDAFNKNILEDIVQIEERLTKKSEMASDNLYKSDSDGEKKGHVKESSDESEECCCGGKVLLDDPNDPRGCLYFQATVRVLRHTTSISPGFQCSVHVGNVRQTAIIQGMLSRQQRLQAGEVASVLFKFSRCPEYLVRGRRLLLTAGLGTRAIGRVTQVFPYVP